MGNSTVETSSMIAFNKRASFDYDFLETFDGGLVLTGAEVKSAKAGHVQLKGAFVLIRNGELWLKNALFSRYEPAGPQESYDPYRNRKILVRRRDINKLIGKIQTQGLTLVPIKVYRHRNLVKVSFALARGKKKYEKRAAIKKRDIERQIREKMKE
ncbi:MAG: SsrA-binding protein SmpB [Candidatus Uhrbacteria bacterium]